MIMGRKVYSFESSERAWAFMRACDAGLIPAGFPGLGVEPGRAGKAYTVEVITSDEQTTDFLAAACCEEMTSGDAF